MRTPVIASPKLLELKNKQAKCVLWLLAKGGQEKSQAVPASNIISPEMAPARHSIHPSRHARMAKRNDGSTDRDCRFNARKPR